MRKIRTALLLLLAVCATFLAAGCAGKDEESEYKFYYLNLEENALAEEAWEPESEDTGTRWRPRSLKRRKTRSI